MSARAIWKGTVSFGLATMPVKVYKATDEASTGMRQLHSACGSPIHRHDHCDKCNATVPYADIAKGVDNGDGTFTILSKDELDGIKPESSDVIAIETFVKAAFIDSIYVDTTYYVTPDGKAGQDTYALLTVLCGEGFAGQGRWTVHGKEHNVIVRPVNGALAVQTMRTVNEVRSATELPGYMAPGAGVNEALLSIGRQLRESMMGMFDATEYEDTFASEFKKLVANKKAGIIDATPKLAKAPAASGDLMSQLAASLANKPAKKTKVAKPTVGSGPKSTKGKKSAEAAA